MPYITIVNTKVERNEQNKHQTKTSSTTIHTDHLHDSDDRPKEPSMGSCTPHEEHRPIAANRERKTMIIVLRIPPAFVRVSADSHERETTRCMSLPCYLISTGVARSLDATHWRDIERDEPRAGNGMSAILSLSFPSLGHTAPYPHPHVSYNHMNRTISQPY